jgi:hypothetical protein
MLLAGPDLVVQIPRCVGASARSPVPSLGASDAASTASPRAQPRALLNHADRQTGGTTSMASVRLRSTSPPSRPPPGRERRSDRRRRGIGDDVIARFDPVIAEPLQPVPGTVGPVRPRTKRGEADGERDRQARSGCSTSSVIGSLDPASRQPTHSRDRNGWRVTAAHNIRGTA